MKSRLVGSFLTASAMEPSLGQQLKKARLDRGLSLAAVAHATRIPEDHLQFLEEDNFAAFGNMVYARSFARIYSNYLEVDASGIMALLPKPVLGGARDYTYLTRSYGPWVESIAKRVRLHIDHPDQAVVHRRRLALILALVIAFVVAMIWRPLGALSKSLPTAQAVTDPALSAPELPQAAPGSMTQPTPASSPPAPTPLPP